MRYKHKRFLVATFLVAGIWTLPATAGAQTLMQSRVCNPFSAPTLTAPAPDTTTDQASIHVVGSGTPSLAVTITKNGTAIGTVQTSDNGAYGVEVPLDPGTNILDAMSTNECGTLKAAPTITVSRAPTATPLRTATTKPRTDETIAGNRTWVSGVAVPHSQVSVYINQVITARITSDDIGSYGALVQLTEGDNQLQVLADVPSGQITLRQVSVHSVKSQAATNPETQTSGIAATIVIAIFATGSLCITGSIWWHIWHVHRSRQLPL